MSPGKFLRGRKANATKAALTSSDFAFVGSFAATRLDDGGLLDRYDNALTFRKKSNGTKVLYTWQYSGNNERLAEVTIPADNLLSGSGVAPYLATTANLGSVLGTVNGKFYPDSGTWAQGYQVPNDQFSLCAFGLHWDEEGSRLYWQSGTFYYEHLYAQTCHGYSTVGESSCTAVGIYKMPTTFALGWDDEGVDMGRCLHHYTTIPSWFRTYVNGNRIGLIGGASNVSINYSGHHQGPSLFALPPITTENNRDTWTGIRRILHYPTVDYSRGVGRWTATRIFSSGGSWNDGWENNDYDCERSGLHAAGVWIDLPTKHGFLFPYHAPEGDYLGTITQVNSANEIVVDNTTDLKVYDALMCACSPQYDSTNFMPVQVTSINGNTIGIGRIRSGGGTPQPLPYAGGQSPTTGSLTGAQTYIHGEVIQRRRQYWSIIDPYDLITPAADQEPTSRVTCSNVSIDTFDWDYRQSAAASSIYLEGTYGLIASQNNDDGHPNGAARAMTYDPETGRLYVLLQDGYHSIFVYQVS